MSTKRLRCLPRSKGRNVCSKSSYRCKVCKKSFTKFIIFEGHFAFNVICRAKNGWFIQCYICGQKFRYLAELKYHIRLHSIPSNKPLKQTECKINGRVINSQNGNSHNSGFQCNICQRNCRTKFCLNEHTLAHSQEAITEKSFVNGDPPVGMVDQLPSSSSTSEKHKIDSPDKEEIDVRKCSPVGGLKCGNCNLPFTTEISLKFHQKLFHQSSATDKPKENSLQCDICQAKFTYIGNLTRHKLVHTVGDVECKICHIKFTKKSLEVHEKEAHQELLGDDAQNDTTKEKQPNDEIAPSAIALQIAEPPVASDSITPPIESVSTPIASEIFAPRIVSETTTPPTSSPVSYICGECCKSVSSLDRLHLHLKSHRPFSCRICGKAFKFKTGLQYHSRCHRFECYICKADFPSTKRLGVHIAKHRVYEQWVDPINVYLSNWATEMSREILQNQPLVLVERLNVRNLTDSAFSNKSKETDLKYVKDEAQVDENNTDTPPIMVNGVPEVPDQDIVQLNHSKKFENSPEMLDVKEKIQPSKYIDDQPVLSFDDDGIIFVEQQPDTTTDDDNVVDISSESDIDEMDLFHCYFCNETFRSLDSLGVHVKTCSFCP